MENRSDPLAVLLSIRDELGLDVDKELIEQCYQLQRIHQYDKDRDTIKKMKALVEEKVIEREGESLL
ncbi:DNA modification system-associated small protein [Vibrio parahaemolyticus]|uniref:DNA modification system-associated small protein n=1 Tax=Vibrio parahaemolyticus TaxID=670 RepID=UPI00111FAD86|nr:DNA modification system-associated small protein [Vibrio parahaemolyticus]MEA5291077.1 DNA modification system-associated small protein [Vibrio parahaemolyticus]TNZ02518.1 hypothetical protein CGK58_21080 [Vibrio parahaemolyticus]TOD54039.1 hypothetical protein CGJ63_03680 [Vibrio parahaemolyticus]TOD82421.1 hypothetical protein CGJ58_05115 [Vibrio parahaemolyticus]